MVCRLRARVHLKTLSSLLNQSARVLSWDCFLTFIIVTLLKFFNLVTFVDLKTSFYVVM